MEGADQGKGAFRYGTLSLIAVLFLTGCQGAVNAGTKPGYSYSRETAFYGENTQVKWFDGASEREAVITVSAPVPGTELPEGIPNQSNQVRGDGLNTAWYARLSSTDNISGIRPVAVTDPYGHELVRNGEEYSCTGYFLGDGWYVFEVPNGITEFSVCTANVIFSGGESDE